MSNCCVCLEDYEHRSDAAQSHLPVTLPDCGHTFCHACVERLLKGGTPVCFTCRAAVTKASVVAQIPVNYALLAVLTTTDSPDTGRSICAECCDRAQWHCEECAAYLCEVHKQMVHASDDVEHHIVACAEYDVKRQRLYADGCCSSHKNDIRTHVCRECAASVCVECALTHEHGNGQACLETLEGFADRTRNQLAAIIADEARIIAETKREEVNRHLRASRAWVSSIKRAREQLQSLRDSAVQHVDQRHRELLRTLDEEEATHSQAHTLRQRQVIDTMDKLEEERRQFARSAKLSRRALIANSRIFLTQAEERRILAMNAAKLDVSHTEASVVVCKGTSLLNADEIASLQPFHVQSLIQSDADVRQALMRDAVDSRLMAHHPGWFEEVCRVLPELADMHFQMRNKPTSAREAHRGLIEEAHESQKVQIYIWQCVNADRATLIIGAVVHPKPHPAATPGRWNLQEALVFSYDCGTPAKSLGSILPISKMRPSFGSDSVELRSTMGAWSLGNSVTVAAKQQHLRDIDFVSDMVSRERTADWLVPEVGQLLDAKDAKGKWYLAAITKVHEGINDDAGAITVGFFGWPSKSDERIDLTDMNLNARLAAPFTHTRGPYATGSQGQFAFLRYDDGTSTSHYQIVNSEHFSASPLKV